ncbi:MAG: CapA family protein [Actinobacteria bacterium]|nr:CapA family protein [Actinomycetota bacterium]
MGLQVGSQQGGPGVVQPNGQPGTATWFAILLAWILMAGVSVGTITGRAPITRQPAATASRRPPPWDAVTLVFGGDVHFESWLRDRVLADPDDALDDMAPLFADADLSVVNLETAVTTRGTRAPKQHTFRAPAEGLTALAAAGVEVVSIANNHGMDFGEVGLDDTLEAAAAADVDVVGGGMTEAAAYAPHRTTISGRRIAVFGATQVLDTFALDAWSPGPQRAGLASAKSTRAGLRHLLAGVRRASTVDDTVVVVLHWGQERRQCPLPRQRRLARRLVDAGADVIVGGHAHRVGPGGFLGDAVVHYGLGNLVFYISDGPGTASGALAVTIAPDDATTLQWRPAALRDGVAAPLDGARRAGALDAWRALRSCTALTAAAGAG